MKRIIALVLSFAMIISLCSGFSFAAYASGEAITAEVRGIYTTSESEQDITIRLRIAGLNTTYCGFTIDGVDLPDGFKLKSFATSNTAQAITAGDYNLTTGKLTYGTNDTEDTIPADTYYDVVVTAPAGAKGTYTVALDTVKVLNIYGSNELVTADTITATITISEPATDREPYEIYYTLSGTTFSGTGDTDAYTDYNIGDTVTATVHLKNNSGADVYLQACDLYLTYNSNLTYTGNTLPKSAAYDSAGVAYGAEGFSGTVSHIQAIGSNESAADISIELKDGATVNLGTITFAINSAAVYDTEMPITLTSGTNIGVGFSATGDKTSYSPKDVSTVSGAEVMTSYTVTWKNEDDTVLDTDTVGYNVMPTYDGETPTKAATDQYTYTFNGWTPALAAANADATYTATYTSTVKGYTVTWKNEDGTVLKTDENVAYGATPSYDGATPTKAADGKYEYKHSGWNPTTVSVTGDAEYTATYDKTPISYKITFEVGEGSLPDGVTSPMEYDCDDTTALPQPTLEGYKFNGWLLDSDTNGWTAGTYTYTDTVNGKWGNVTLVAQWLDANFEVTIGESANGTVSANPLAGDVGTKITLTANPAAGYKWVSYTVTHTADSTQSVKVNSDGTFEMPAADVTVTAIFEKDNLAITVSNPDGNNGTVSSDKTIAQVGDTVTLSNTPNAGYELKEYKVAYTDGNNQEQTVAVNADGTFEMPAYPVTVTATFQKKSLDITIVPVQHGSVSAQDGDGKAITTAKLDESVTLVPNADNGYELASWTVTYNNGTENVNVTVTSNSFTMPEYPVTVTASYTAINYKITYMDGDTEISNLTPTTYTIESTDKLPTYSKNNYTFEGWKVTSGANDKWAENSVIDAETALTGYYGTVTLTAQWDEAITYAIDDYKYAKNGYVMLRIATNSNANAYTFNSESMYYTTDSSYLVSGSDASGVFYTLISADYVSNGKLTEAGMAKLVAGTEAAKTIDYTSGDINGDGVTNIADANIVYQMIVNGGGYYTDLSANNRTDTESRLMADMNKEAYSSSVARATIADVNAIVAIINGTATN